MRVVGRVLAAVWRGAVEVVWGSTPQGQHPRPADPLAVTSVELERARQRAATTSLTTGGGS